MIVNNGKVIAIDKVKVDYSSISGDGQFVPIGVKREFVEGVVNEMNIGDSYDLPIASDTVLGGVRIGENLSIDGFGVLSADATVYSAGYGIVIDDSYISVDNSYIGDVVRNNFVTYLENYVTSEENDVVQEKLIAGEGISINGVVISSNVEFDEYELPIASDTVLGGVKISDGIDIDYGVISINDSYVGDIVENNFVTNLENYVTSEENDVVQEKLIAGDGISIDDGVISSTVKFDEYELPTASESVLGGVKVGDNLNIDQDGVLSAVDTKYTLPTATESTLGGVKVGSGLSINGSGVLSTIYSAGDGIDIDDGVINIDKGVIQEKLTAGENISIDGNVISADDTKYTAGTNISIDKTNKIISAVDTKYTLPTASASVLGGVKIGNNLNIDQDGVLSATDLDTTYSAGDGIDIDDGVINIDKGVIQEKLTAGENISIDGNVISADDTKYTAGTNISIDKTNKIISAVDTKYTAGDNISIDETNKISVVSGEFVSEINSSEETLLISEESDIEGQKVIDINVNKDLLQTKIFVDTVEDLKAIENPQEGDVIILNGYWVVGDAPPVTYVFTIPRDFDGEYDEDEMDWYFFNNYGGYKYAEGTALIRPYQEGVVGAWRMVMEEDFIDCRNFGIFPTSQSVAYANEEGEIIGYYAQRYRNHPYFETEEYQENHYIRYGDYDNRVYIHFSKRIGRFLQFCAYNSKEAYFPQLLSISNKNTPSYYCIDIESLYTISSFRTKRIRIGYGVQFFDLNLIKTEEDDDERLCMLNIHESIKFETGVNLTDSIWHNTWGCFIGRWIFSNQDGKSYFKHNEYSTFGDNSLFIPQTFIGEDSFFINEIISEESKENFFKNWFNIHLIPNRNDEPLNF